MKMSSVRATRSSTRKTANDKKMDEKLSKLPKLKKCNGEQVVEFGKTENDVNCSIAGESLVKAGPFQNTRSRFNNTLKKEKKIQEKMPELLIILQKCDVSQVAEQAITKKSMDSSVVGKSLVKKRECDSSEKRREDKIKENTEQEKTGTNLNIKRLKNKKKKVNGKDLGCVPMEGVTEMDGNPVPDGKSLVKRRERNSSEKRSEDKIEENTEQERTGTNLNTKRLKSKKKKVNRKELGCVPMEGVTEMDRYPVPDDKSLLKRKHDSTEKKRKDKIKENTGQERTDTNLNTERLKNKKKKVNGKKMGCVPMQGVTEMDRNPAPDGKSLLKKRKHNSKEKKRGDKNKEKTGQERTDTNVNTERLKNKKKKVDEKEMGCEALTQGPTEMDGNLVPDGMEQAVCVNKLSHEVLIYLFKFFSRDDVVSCQRVCHDMRAAAQSYSLWKYYTLTVSEKPEDERKIRIMPALRNIKGYTKNNMINVIQESVTDLRKLNCKFHPPMSPLQLQGLIDKYPQLESITLSMDVRDTLASVWLLKNSLFIKEVVLKPLDFNKYVFCKYSADHLSEMLIIFRDNKTFPVLESIDFSSTFLSVFYEPYLTTIFTDIIKIRSQQLRSLTVPVYHLGSACMIELLNAVKVCKNLYRLRLKIQGEYSVNINIDAMTQLRLLQITICTDVGKFSTAFYNSLYCGSWLHLTELDLLIECFIRPDILMAITKNVKQLIVLSYKNTLCRTDETQLQHLNNLSKLETFNLDSLQNLSETGISYLSSCCNLKCLSLYINYTWIDNLNLHFVNMLQNMRTLQVFSCSKNDYNIRVDLRSKQEIEWFISESLSQA